MPPIFSLDELEKKDGCPLLRSVLISVVKEVFLRIIKSGNYGNELYTEFLRDSDTIADPPSPLERMSLDRYPYRPYYLYIADTLYIWGQTGSPPSLPIMNIDYLNEIELDFYYLQDKILNLIHRISEDIIVGAGLPLPCVTGYKLTDLWIGLFGKEKYDYHNCQSYHKRRLELSCRTVNNSIMKSTIIKVTINEKLIQDTMDCLIGLGSQTLLSFIGMRYTITSQRTCPPSRSSLVTAFNEHCGESKLPIQMTLGASSINNLYPTTTSETTSSWKQSSSSTNKMDTIKNEFAMKMIHYLLNQAKWIHCYKSQAELGREEEEEEEDDVTILEIRTGLGYGASWKLHPSTYEVLKFLTFLEP